MEQATYLSGLMIVEAKLNIDGTRVSVADICDACDLVAKLRQNPRYAASAAVSGHNLHSTTRGSVRISKQGALAGES